MLWRAAVVLIAGALSFDCVAQGSAEGEPRPATEQSADDPSALIAKARELATNGDNDAALEKLGAALAQDARNREARQLRGDLYFKIGDLDKAMADFAELRSANSDPLSAPPSVPLPPTHGSAVSSDLFRRAAAAEAKGDLDAAVALYNTVLTMDVPYHHASTALQNRGNIYRSKNDDERALSDYEQAIRLNPMNPGAYVNRGTILAARGDYEAAIQDFSEAIRFDPKLHQAFSNRGAALMQIGDHERALRDFDEAIRLYPEFAPGYGARGDFFAAQGKFAKARADFEKAARLDPKGLGPLVSLAHLAVRNGRYAAALTKLEKAKAIKGDIPVVLNSLSWLRATAPPAAVRNGKKAVADAQRACELTNWASFAYVDTLAAAYAESGEFEKAADFEWYALSLADEVGEENRRGAEERLRLYQQRRKYRETKPPEPTEPGEPAKTTTPETGPTPPPLRPRGGPVRSSSLPPRPSGDPAPSPRALPRSSCAALQSCCRSGMSRAPRDGHSTCGIPPGCCRESSRRP